jgi:hypothetical protein
MEPELLPPQDGHLAEMTPKLKLRYLPFVVAGVGGVAVVLCFAAVIEAVLSIFAAVVLASLLLIGAPILFIGAWRETRRKALR